MSDPTLTRFARTLIQYSLDTRPGDVVAIRTTTLALPLVREVMREALVAGAHLLPRLTFDGQEEAFYAYAGESQLDWVSPIDAAEMEHVTARLTIQAPFNTR